MTTVQLNVEAQAVREGDLVYDHCHYTPNKWVKVQSVETSDNVTSICLGHVTIVKLAREGVAVQREDQTGQAYSNDEETIRRVVKEQSAVLVDMQRILHEAGLHETARKINEASQKLGWEACRLIDRANGVPS